MPGALQDWIGRQQTEADVITPFPARGMMALLDRDPQKILTGMPLPPAWHWLYFRPLTQQSIIDVDGHERRGEFLPPVEAPRRMWAGGRLRFISPLLIGQHATRTSTVRSIDIKEGRTGPLTFVIVDHVIHTSNGPVIEEQQRLVYLGHAVGHDDHRPTEANPAALTSDDVPVQYDWSETFLPTAVVLFRFSALTFNGHRIHYDHPYATVTEGHRGLLVHAPLTALVLLDAALRHIPHEQDVRDVDDSRSGLARRRSLFPSLYEFRATNPLYGDEPVKLSGSTIEGVSTARASAAGTLAMHSKVYY